MTQERKSKGSDKGPALPADREPTPRLVRTGLALLAGETSLGAAMRRGGYAETTSLSPLHSGHVTVARALQAARKAQGEDIDANTARDVGLRTVLDLARDKQEPGGTRGAAAKVLLDFAASAGVEDSPIGRADYLRAYLDDASRLVRALDLAARRPDLARRYRDKLTRRIEAWAAEYDLLSPAERTVSVCASTRETK